VRSFAPPAAGWAAVMAALLLTVTGCTGGADDVGSGGGLGFVSGDGSAQVISPDDRVELGEVSGTTLEGEPLALDDFAGDVIVMNVWGSWCAPCRAEAPALQQVFADTQKQGVQFVGINTRDQEAAAIAFEKNFGITYPSLVDKNGQLQLAFRESLPANSIPSTLVIDRDGRVAARVLGATTYSQLTDLVDQVASES
jgi:thiol-disulfide isomerase/thioredoxin